MSIAAYFIGVISKTINAQVDVHIQKKGALKANQV
jgi:hypothetical protein